MLSNEDRQNVIRQWVIKERKKYNSNIEKDKPLKDSIRRIIIKNEEPKTKQR